MDAPEAVIALVRDWLRKADNDLINAVHTLKLGGKCPTDTVCFHAQQCVEKHLKALLVLLGIPFSRTHDIAHLMSMVPLALAPSLNADQQDLLTDYAASIRYPSSNDEVSLSEARKAVAMARLVRREIRRQIPRSGKL